MATPKYLEFALGEKAALLREVHHRVNNNLQILSSLLSLQGRQSDDRTKTILGEAASRVRAMALIHQQIHAHSSLVNIDLRAYLQNLCRSIISMARDRTEIAVDGDRLELGIDRAMPLGLLLNELLSSSAKHGRSEDGVARIRILLRQTPTGFQVAVSDEGPGRSETSRNDLSWHMVKALTRQLRGEVSCVTRSGFVVRLDIPLTPSGVSDDQQRRCALGDAPEAAL